MSATGLAGVLLLVWSVAVGDAAVGDAAERHRSDPEAVRLLREAAQAARRVAYEGVQSIVRWTGGAITPSLVDIAHSPERGTRLEVRRPATTARGIGVVDARHATSIGDFTGITGYTDRMLDLLVRDHAVVSTGSGTACSRAARVVAVRRRDGSVAGRFWIDRASGLMLRREMVDQRGRVVSSTAFTELRLVRPKVDWGAEPATVAAPWGTRLGTATLDRLRRQGWVIPRGLPGNLTLYEARQDDSRSVVHLGYTDGLAVVSVFVQRGVLDETRVIGFRRVSQKGRTVYLRNAVQQRILWGSRGYVYAVVADAPPSIVGAAVAALPHGRAGFWARLSRGFDRLVS